MPEVQHTMYFPLVRCSAHGASLLLRAADPVFCTYTRCISPQEVLSARREPPPADCTKPRPTPTMAGSTSCTRHLALRVPAASRDGVSRPTTSRLAALGSACADQSLPSSSNRFLPLLPSPTAGQAGNHWLGAPCHPRNVELDLRARGGPVGGC